MKILHVLDVEIVKSNGVVSSMLNSLQGLKKYSDVAIYNLNKEISVEDIDVYDYSMYSNIFQLPNGYNKPDLVIFNEVYKVKYIKLYRECLKNEMKYIIIPHGCLTYESQNQKKMKKVIGNIIFFNRFIKKAAAVQFLNESEKNKSNFIYQKSLIISNGITLNKNFALEKKYNNNLIYVGRYSVYTKGLDLLVDVCYSNKEWFEKNDVKIEMYGTGVEKEISKLKGIIKRYKINNIIKLNGPIYGKEKQETLKKSYCFIQLSRHEGQPMGIIEALSLGLPCICTNQTNFGNYVKDNNCGFGCRFNKDEVFESIQQIYSDHRMRNIFSSNAVKSICRDFSCDTIAKQTIQEYKKML